MYSIRLFLFSIGMSLLSSQIQAAYALLEAPNTWTFQVPTPAFNDPEKSKALGDFQPNIRVRVLAQLLDKNLWHVEFISNTSTPIQAYIEPPINALSQNQSAFHAFSDTLSEFALLSALLREDNPWSLSPRYLQKTFFNVQAPSIPPEAEPLLDLLENNRFLHNSAVELKGISIWEWTPKELYIDYRNPNQHRITINLWNRGDSKLKWKAAYKQLNTLTERFRKLETLLGNANTRFAMEKKISQGEITALRQNIEYFFLANDLIVQLRWSRNEFISIDLLSYQEQVHSRPNQSNKHELSATLKQSVTETPNGYYVINSIPMISQGDKGYCAPASLARILQYYGYPVSMHALSELSETSASEGTHMDEIFSSVQRVCKSTPFKIKVLDSPRRKELVSLIQRGIPLYWIIPGHARLINGIHPEGGIIYTDSWGHGHAFKSMSWSEFKNLNKTVFALEIQ